MPRRAALILLTVLLIAFTPLVSASAGHKQGACQIYYHTGYHTYTTASGYLVSHYGGHSYYANGFACYTQHGHIMHSH